MKKVILSMGAPRASHAAMVAAAAVMWSGYGNTHADTFANANLEKFVITNAEGAIVARNSKVAELVKSDLYTNSSALRHEEE